MIYTTEATGNEKYAFCKNHDEFIEKLNGQMENLEISNDYLKKRFYKNFISLNKLSDINKIKLINNLLIGNMASKYHNEIIINDKCKQFFNTSKTLSCAILKVLESELSKDEKVEGIFVFAVFLQDVLEKERKKIVAFDEMFKYIFEITNEANKHDKLLISVAEKARKSEVWFYNLKEEFRKEKMQELNYKLDGDLIKNKTENKINKI